jgi:flagellar biosynthetic protein FliR
VVVRVDPQVAVGFVLAMVRAVAWLVVAPPFSSRTVPAKVKVGFAAALALAVGARLPDQAVALEPGPLVGAVVTQVAIGVVLGFVALVLFASFQSAGALIDLFGGFSAAQVLDPHGGTHTTVFGQLYLQLATVLLFVTGGHLLLVRGFLRSFDAVPTAGPRPGTVADLLARDVGGLMVAAIEIAAPLLAALFLADLALGLLNRAAPEMNVFVIGLPLKILLTIGLAGLALPLLPGATATLVERMVHDGLRAVGVG